MASQAASQGQDGALKLEPSYRFIKTLAKTSDDAGSRTLCAKFTEATRPLFLARQPGSKEAARRPWVVLGSQVDGVPACEVAEFKEAAVAGALQYLNLPQVRATPTAATAAAASRVCCRVSHPAWPWLSRPRLRVVSPVL